MRGRTIGFTFAWAAYCCHLTLITVSRYGLNAAMVRSAPGVATMPEPAASARSAGFFVVLREVLPGRWDVVGEASRGPGLTARKARQL